MFTRFFVVYQLEGLRFLYIFGDPGLLCGTPGTPRDDTPGLRRDHANLVTYIDIFCILPETRVLFDHTGQVE